MSGAALSLRPAEGSDYVLPARFDDTELRVSGQQPATSTLREIAPLTLVDLVLNKLGSQRDGPNIAEGPPDDSLVATRRPGRLRGQIEMAPDLDDEIGDLFGVAR